jgi:hypothetical protein
MRAFARALISSMRAAVVIAALAPAGAADDHAAARVARAAAARGITLVAGEREPTVLVSPACRSRVAAQRAARRYRALFSGAFARRFTRWIR